MFDSRLKGTESSMVYGLVDIFILFFNDVYIFVWVCAREFSTIRRSDEGVRSHGAGVSGSCETPGMGAGDQTQVPCKNSMNS